MIEPMSLTEKFSDEGLMEKVSVFLQKIMVDYKRDAEHVNLVFCDDAQIQEYNRDYRKKNTPTDVLSFSQKEGEELDAMEEGVTPLGDILISVERAEVQAVEYEVTFEEEITRLAVHGMLHLLGYDHEKSHADEVKMFEIQDRYLDQFIPKK